MKSTLLFPLGNSLAMAAAARAKPEKPTRIRSEKTS